MNSPAMQFYVGDLMREPSFTALSLAAQGLWLRMIFLMHDACKPGLLVNANGMQMSCKILARIIGRPIEEIEPLLAEMEALGTYSKLEDGTIYCRRMSRGTDLSEKRSQAARSRWAKEEPMQTACKPDANSDAKHAASSSSSTSSSTSTSKKPGETNTQARPTIVEASAAAPPNGVVREIPAAHADFERWWAGWSQIRGTNHRPQAFEAWLVCVKQAHLPDVFDCTASYLDSLESPAKGFNPENFLRDQARSNFRARWPHKRAGPAQERKQAATEKFRERMHREMAEHGLRKIQ